MFNVLSYSLRTKSVLSLNRWSQISWLSLDMVILNHSHYMLQKTMGLGTLVSLFEDHLWAKGMEPLPTRSCPCQRGVKSFLFLDPALGFLCQLLFVLLACQIMVKNRVHRFWATKIHSYTIRLSVVATPCCSKISDHIISFVLHVSHQHRATHLQKNNVASFLA